MSGYTERPFGRNDRCHCGSGKKYKHCCLAKDQAQGRRLVVGNAPITPLTNLESLRQNTLDFINCLRGDLDIHTDHQSGIGVFRGEIEDSAVQRTFNRLPYFFPHDAKYEQVYRDIAAAGTSGMYWGSRNVNCISDYLARYALYTPQIIVANPFCDRMLYHLDRSPVDHPAMWKQVVANRAMFLLSIEPWIREGVIIVLPTLKWTEWKFYDEQIRVLAKKRIGSFTPEQDSRLRMQSFFDFATSLDPQTLEKFISTYMADAPPIIVDELRRRVQSEFADSPARYAWMVNEKDQITSQGPGNNLEATIYQADLCKSYLLFGERDYRDEYEFSLQNAGSLIPNDGLTQVSKAFASLTFSFLNHVDLDFVLGLRKDNRLASLRAFLHRTWSQATTIEGIERLNADSAFKEALEAEYEQYKKEWGGIQKKLGLTAGASVVGAAVSVLTGQFGLSVALGGLAVFKLQELLKSKHERDQLSAFHLAYSWT